jgi:hypothetical protein
MREYASVYNNYTLFHGSRIHITLQLLIILPPVSVFIFLLLLFYDPVSTPYVTSTKTVVSAVGKLATNYDMCKTEGI